jgi:cytidine deaminase
LAESDRPRTSERRKAERRQGDRRSGTDRRADADWADVPVVSGERVSAEEVELVLLEAARAVRERAHAPYSNFQVGAALESADGDVLIGCNVENATYGLTICAERAALFRAIADGHRRFTRIVIVADSKEATPPCGPCRQLLWELCGDIDVVLANLDRVTGRYRVSELLPVPFDRRSLK